MPCGTTQSALSGGVKPGTAGIGGFQADVIGARRARLDAHALAADADAAVDRRALGDGEVGLEASELAHRRAAVPDASADRARAGAIGPALNTPPLNSTAVGAQSACVSAAAPTSARERLAGLHVLQAAGEEAGEMLAELTGSVA